MCHAAKGGKSRDTKTCKHREGTRKRKGAMEELPAENEDTKKERPASDEVAEKD